MIPGLPGRFGSRRVQHWPGRARARSAAVILLLGLVTATAPALWSCSSERSGSADVPTLPDSSSFLLPRRIVVSVVPFASVDEALAAEQAIDWADDPQAARAIKLAYAASELRKHLALVGIDTTFSGTPASPTDPAIVLWSRGGDGLADSTPPQDLPVSYEALGDQGYALTPRDGSVFVTANAPAGVLYGVYDLLERLGFAWYDPYETIVPRPSTLMRPIVWTPVQARPRVGLRGFWIYGDATVPDAFAVWLARNRLNIGGLARWPLQQKLGLTGWGGGHTLLQQEFSRPGLFEEHPDWFALVDGSRRPVAASGTYFNPSFASVDAAGYFAERMIERLEAGDLRGIDVLNIWPADDRFNRFDQSAAARALGNETDNLLFFYANVGRRLREAHAEARLSRPVRIGGISYFLTMSPPRNPAVVQALADTGYLHLFYPIERDWSGLIDSNLAGRDSNRRLVTDLAAWQSVGTLDFGVVEYHNLSAFGAIGLSDLEYFAANYGRLTDGRDHLYAYMHPLLRNPGPRRLTNGLLARLGWEEVGAAGSDAELIVRGEQIVAQYFRRRYGDRAPEWHAIHLQMSRSVENAKEMFGTNSLLWLLFQEQLWNPAFYTRAEVVEYLPLFRIGGTQDLPAGFSGVPTERETFRGLDESIRLQSEASVRWRAILSGSLAPDVRRRMEADVEWFEATASRYRLMAATCDYVTARQRGGDLTEPRARAMREIELLRLSTVLSDTVSPVDQDDFLGMHALLVGTGE